MFLSEINERMHKIFALLNISNVTLNDWLTEYFYYFLKWGDSGDDDSVGNDSGGNDSGANDSGANDSGADDSNSKEGGKFDWYCWILK